MKYNSVLSLTFHNFYHFEMLHSFLFFTVKSNKQCCCLNFEHPHSNRVDDHTTIKLPELERTSKDTLVQPFVEKGA